MKTTKALAAAILAAISFAAGKPAVATDLSYNYAEFGYTFRTEFFDTNLDGDGFTLSGSLEVAPNILALAQFADLSFDNNVDYDEFFIGAGYLRRMDPRFDLIGSGEIGRVKAKGPSGSESETGFRLAAGIRGILVPRADGFARLVHVNADGSDTFVEAGARYQFTKQISVGGKFEVGSDLDRWTLNVRFDF